MLFLRKRPELFVPIFVPYLIFLRLFFYLLLMLFNIFIYLSLLNSAQLVSYIATLLRCLEFTIEC